jgi:Fur family transcriptional regulator, ferric uptake regulator
MARRIRETSQRQALLEAFDRAAGPLSPQEALEAASRRARGLGIATVYRNLKAMVDQDVLKTVSLPGQPGARYERQGKEHHHHFHCRRCHQVFEIAGCPGNIEPLVPRGFALEDHEVVLYGLCRACRKSERKR